MRTSTFATFTFILFLCFVTTAAAETGYITDQLVVTVRSNKTNSYQTLTTLSTASPVEILEKGKTFVKVRTQKGIEGYISKQYVSKNLPKSLQLKKLQTLLTASEKQLAQQQLEFQGSATLASSSQETITQLTDELDQARQQLSRVTEEFDKLQKSSGNVINLATERDQLLAENNQIGDELAILQTENANFHRSNMIQWFLAGGGVFLGGWLIGKVSRQKRRHNRF